MKPGDVIAFGGRGIVSWIIRKWTRSPISHVGIVSRVMTGGIDSIRVMESTSLDGFTGVTETRLSQRLAHYRGEIYWLPLSQRRRNALNLKLYYQYIYAMEGRAYDAWQAIRSATFDGAESHDKLFCSELAAGALEAGRVIDAINCSAVTPQDLCAFNLYHFTAHQLKGHLVDIPNYNTKNPENFGL